MKKIYLLLVFILPLLLRAQQDPQYSMYFFNGQVLNPAYVGSRDFGSITLIGRKQWLGMNGSPATASFGFHSPVGRSLHGAGLTLIQDNIGVTSTTTMNGQFAFRFPVGKGNLAFGLQLQGSLYKANLNSVPHEDPNDPAFTGNNVSIFLPNAGAGAYYNTDHFYAGISIPHFVNNPLVNKNSDSTFARRYAHYLFTSGVVIPAGDMVKIKPSFLLKYVGSGQWSLDLNASVLLNERIWAGISYRHKDAIAGVFEYYLTNQFRFGYSYDFPITPLRTATSGSHELMLGWDFTAGKKGLTSPRYF